MTPERIVAWFYCEFGTLIQLEASEKKEVGGGVRAHLVGEEEERANLQQGWENVGESSEGGGEIRSAQPRREED